MPTTLHPLTHRSATADEMLTHDHDWRIYMTHSLLPAGDGHTFKCECGAIRAVMKPIPGERSERFWLPI